LYDPSFSRMRRDKLSEIYTFSAQEKYFILRGEKYYFSSLDYISFFSDINHIKATLYLEDKAKKKWLPLSIPLPIAQDLINMSHVRVDFGNNAFFKRVLK
jgi:hypothetical protein